MSETTLEFYTIDEVADLLRVSKSMVYSMVQGKKLPGIKVGKLVRIPKAGLEEWLKNGGKE